MFGADMARVAPESTPATLIGDFYHTPKDAQKAVSLVGADETIVAIWRVRPEHVNGAACTHNDCKFLCFCPCCWPIVCCTSPCICYPCSPCISHCQLRSVMRSTVYILTDKKLYRDVAPECCQCRDNNPETEGGCFCPARP